MESLNNPQEHSSPGWLFVAIGRPGFGAAGLEPTAEPVALDIILDRRDGAGGPLGTGGQSGVAGASAAAAGSELSQSSSKSSMSKASSSRSGCSAARLLPAGLAVAAALGARRAVLHRGWIPFLAPGLRSQLLSQDWGLSRREAPSLPPPLGHGSSAAPGQGVSSALCLEAQELPKVRLVLAEKLLE